MPAEQFRSANDELTREKEALERDIAREYTATFEDPLAGKSLADVRALLDPGEVFIDMYRYGFKEAGRFREERYAAVIVPGYGDLRLPQTPSYHLSSNSRKHVQQRYLP